jgi:cytochrome d ubiquinol oxidase subunit II
VRVLEGIPVNGFFAGWTTPFAISCGLFAQALFALVSAVYLTMDTRDHPELQDDFRRRALASGVTLAPTALFVFILSKQGAPIIFEDLTSWWGPWLLLVTSACAFGALASLWRRRFAVARLAAAGQVGWILLGWGLAQRPFLVVPDLTITNAAAPAVTLRLVLVGLSAGALVLFPSLWYLFRVFKGRGDPSQIGDYD